MTEITRVHLENEMDLILAHKQAMKLAELCGLNLPIQTTLATAVSELGRAGLEAGTRAVMLLHVSDKGELPKAITVHMRFEPGAGISDQSAGYLHARKLIRSTRMLRDQTSATAELTAGIPAGTRIDVEITDRWRRYMNSDPSVSPYEEIKRKNRQLQELADRLRDSEQQYRDLTDSLPLVIFTIDAEGKALFGNRWLGEYSGQSLDEINGTNWSSVFHAGQHADITANFRKLASGDFVKDMEYRLRHADSGEYRWHMGTITPVQNDDGATMYWSVFMADIHAQKEVEAMLKDNHELRETQALLEEKVAALDASNRQLEQFAYVASHDLQEPLRKIRVFSGMLGSAEELTAPNKAILGKISGSAGRMTLLVQDLLSFSRLLQSDNLMQPVSLRATIETVWADFDLLAQEKEASLELGELPVIEAIHFQMSQLFNNLISNALKFTAPGRAPVIRIASQPVEGSALRRYIPNPAPAGAYHHITVSDNGIGFDAQYHDQIFEVFKRLHSRDQYPGSGIGLSLCKRIAVNHNGCLFATSAAGEGSVFHLYLPERQHA